MSRKKKSKKKKLINKIALVVSIITLIASALFLLSVKHLGIIPDRYIIYGAVGLLLFNVLFGFIGISKHVNSFNKWLQTIICSLLSVLMLVVAVLIPGYKGRIEQVLTPIPETTTLNIHVYTLAESENETIADIVGKDLGIQETLDIEHQAVALEDINNEISKRGTINTVKYDDIYSAAEALYNNEVDAILLTDVYADVLSDNDDFNDFGEKTKIIYTVTQEVVEEHVRNAVPSITNTPFVVAIAGNDSSDYYYINNNRGRTDVNMLLVVNPLSKKILMVTITRDAYLPINGEMDKMDRLTNSSIFGVEVWKNTIKYLIDTDINYFVRVNFSSLVNIVNAIGGIDINNPIRFQSRKHLVFENGYGVYRSFWYDKGDIHLDGNHALLYVRERYAFDDGDFTRNKNQARVLKAIINKLMSPAVLNYFDSLLSAVQGTFVTDFSMDEIYKLVQMQLDDMASWTFETCSVTGTVGWGTSYTVGAGQGSSQMYVVYVDENTVKEAQDKINRVLKEDIYDRVMNPE